MPSPESEALGRILDGYARVLCDPSVPVGVRIGYASELWSAIETAKAALDPIKDHLRDKAVADLGGKPGAITYDGDNLSLAVVVVPGVAIRATDKFNAQEAQQVLGANFDRIFKVGVTPRSEALEVINTLPIAKRHYLSGVVSMDNGKPRVSLRSLTGVEPTK